MYVLFFPENLRQSLLAKIYTHDWLIEPDEDIELDVGINGKPHALNLPKCIH